MNKTRHAHPPKIAGRRGEFRTGDCAGGSPGAGSIPSLQGPSLYSNSPTQTPSIIVMINEKGLTRPGKNACTPDNHKPIAQPLRSLSALSMATQALAAGGGPLICAHAGAAARFQNCKPDGLERRCPDSLVSYTRQG